MCVAMKMHFIWCVSSFDWFISIDAIDEIHLIQFICCISFISFDSFHAFHVMHFMHFIWCISCISFDAFHAFHLMHFMHFIWCISFDAFHFHGIVARDEFVNPKDEVKHVRFQYLEVPDWLKLTWQTSESYFWGPDHLLWWKSGLKNEKWLSWFF
jgi:hypothetical protein